MQLPNQLQIRVLGESLQSPAPPLNDDDDDDDNDDDDDTKISMRVLKSSVAKLEGPKLQQIGFFDCGK